MPFSLHPQGLTVRIRLTPGARRTGFDGVMTGADGKAMLKVSVNAVPENGKANDALIAFLAKSWKVPKSSIVLLSGTTNRIKTLLIAGNSQALMERLPGCCK